MGEKILWATSHIADDTKNGEQLEVQFVSKAQVSRQLSPEREASSPAVRNAAVRALPTTADVKERCDNNPDLCSFYLQVVPLLKGAVTVGAYRRSRQRFEERQLLLSSDLRRLELWPMMEASFRDFGASVTAASIDPDAMHDNGDMVGPSGNVLGSLATTKARRKGFAEVFLRIEALVRVHVPKATLSAVQQAITGARTNGDQRTGQFEAGADNLADCTPPEGCGFVFELVISGNEPWRLLANDLHTFHVVTAALGALLTFRTSLPSFAATLDIGPTSASLRCDDGITAT